MTTVDSTMSDCLGPSSNATFPEFLAFDPGFAGQVPGRMKLSHNLPPLPRPRGRRERRRVRDGGRTGNLRNEWPLRVIRSPSPKARKRHELTLSCEHIPGIRRRSCTGRYRTAGQRELSIVPLGPLLGKNYGACSSGVVQTHDK